MAVVPQEVHSHTYANGLTLLAEPMPHVRSAALNFLIPAGCAYDPPDQLGLTSMFVDLLMRGAGNRDSRELSLALDNLGFDRDESAGVLNVRLFGATLARNLPAALDIYADIIRRPHLPEDELDSARSLALQDLQGLEDSPQAKVMLELRNRYYPDPLNKSRLGTEQGLQNVTHAAIRRQFQERFRPAGTIISVAGNVDWPALRDQVERLFGDWTGESDPTPNFGPSRTVREHLPKDTEQTQIALAWSSVPVNDPEYYPARGAASVLSGGMGARLFTEVREKRGLCYHVFASHEPLKDRGTMLGYAGTRAERAQETLDVMMQVFRTLADGVTDDEIERLRAGLKSALIMQEESTAARAGAIASDWYHLGRVRSFDEIQAAIDGLTAERIVEHVRRFPPEKITVVTLGPAPLSLTE